MFGQLGGSFQQFFLGNLASSAFHHRLNKLTLYYLYLGVGQFLTTYISAVGFMYTGEHITQKLREQYLTAILRKNIAIYDTLGAGEITSTITANMDLVLLGTSEKIAITISALTTFVAALIVGFTKNWRLSAVLLSIVFAVLFVMAGFSVMLVRYNKATLDAYAPGAAVAEEAFTSIRTVTALNGQHRLASKYEHSLDNTMHWGFRMKSAVGCMIGSMILVTYLAYALGFWEGSRLLVAGHANLSQTLTVLLALLTGAVSIAHAAPHIQAFAGAVSAAADIFKIIDRPASDDRRGVGQKLQNVEGAFEFREIKHVYPSRPEVTVLEDFNLVIPAGKVTALVGASGSGKSTIVGLVERFYTPVRGQVLLDGNDTQTLDLKWLRRQMSLVSQEPVLFNCSIRANIEHGMTGKDIESASEEKEADLVTKAAKMANAHEFIIGLPNGYETVVGDRGLLLSGGQKQRISIARAIISNPKILLLDEATSALDSRSEGVVQAALDVASQGRTTIVVAHRLSSIKNADNIVVLNEGRIVEQGTHDGLLSQKGAYCHLIEAQKLTAEKRDGKLSLNRDAGLQRPSNEIVLDSGYVKKDLEARVSSTASIIAAQKMSSQGNRDSLWTIIKLVVSFNKSETGIMLLGLFCSILAGGGMPVQGVIFAKCIVSLSLPATQYTQVRSDLNYWSLVFVAVALTVFIVSSGHGVAFAYCSECLYVSLLPHRILTNAARIHRARNLTFRTILRQSPSYFDTPLNNPGTLTSLLTKSTTDLAGISGAVLGAMLQLVTTIVTAITLSCIVGWKLGLVCSSTIPILLLCGFSRIWVLGRFQNRAQKAYTASAAIACEAVSSIFTIASLTREQDVWDTYHSMVEAQLATSLRSILKTTLLYAASQSFSLFCMALGFWYGGTLMLSRQYSMFQFFVCFTSVIFSAQSAGALFSFAPDMAKSREAAQQLKDLWEAKPEIDSCAEEGERISGPLDGRVEFQDVCFEYPTRTGQLVLRNLSFTIEPGQFVALVGASGCGKSTVIGLLERFYDPKSGRIFVDGKDVSKLNVNEYRSQLALVAQEPVLYSGTIRENVLLAVEGAQVSDEDVEAACRKANIWDFVVGSPPLVPPILNSFLV